MDRRTFVQSLGAALALPAVPGPRCRAPYPLGLQLYTVRRFLRADPARTLAVVARAGYVEVEFAGYADVMPARLRRMLDDAGLAAPAAHVGLDALAPAQLPATLDAAAVLGHRWLVVPWLPAADRTPDGYARTGERLAAAGAAARAHGVRVAWHNHDFELAPLPDGRRGLDLLLAASDPSTVDLELDLFWAAQAGADPAALLRETAARVRLVHVKDRGGPPDHAMRDVGDGMLDWPAILAAARAAGVAHAFVEHDEPADALASIRRSAAYLARLP